MSSEPSSSPAPRPDEFVPVLTVLGTQGRAHCAVPTRVRDTRFAIGAADVIIVHGLCHGFDSGGFRHRSTKRDAPASLSGRQPVSELLADPFGHRLHIGQQSFGCGVFRIDGVGEDAADLRDALSGHCRRDAHIRLAQTILVEQLTEMVGCGLLLFRAEFVDLIEDDDHVRAVLGEFRQVFGVQ